MDKMFEKKYGIVFDCDDEEKSGLINFVTHLHSSKPVFPKSAKCIYTSKYLEALINKHYKFESGVVSAFHINTFYKIKINDIFITFKFIESMYAPGTISVILQDTDGTFLHTGPFIFHKCYLGPLMPLIQFKPLKGLSAAYNTKNEQMFYKSFDAICEDILECVGKAQSKKVHFHLGENCYHILCYLLERLQDICFVQKDQLEVMNLLGYSKYFEYVFPEITRLTLFPEGKDVFCGRDSDLCIHIFMTSKEPQLQCRTERRRDYYFSCLTTISDCSQIQTQLRPQIAETFPISPCSSHFTLMPEVKPASQVVKTISRLTQGRLVNNGGVLTLLDPQRYKIFREKTEKDKRKCESESSHKHKNESIVINHECNEGDTEFISSEYMEQFEINKRINSHYNLFKYKTRQTLFSSQNEVLKHPNQNVFELSLPHKRVRVPSCDSFNLVRKNNTLSSVDHKVLCSHDKVSKHQKKSNSKLPLLNKNVPISLNPSEPSNTSKADKEVTSPESRKCIIIKTSEILLSSIEPHNNSSNIDLKVPIPETSNFVKQNSHHSVEKSRSNLSLLNATCTLNQAELSDTSDGEEPCSSPSFNFVNQNSSQNSVDYENQNLTEPNNTSNDHKKVPRRVPSNSVMLNCHDRTLRIKNNVSNYQNVNVPKFNEINSNVMSSIKPCKVVLEGLPSNYFLFRDNTYLIKFRGFRKPKKLSKKLLAYRKLLKRYSEMGRVDKGEIS